MPDPDSVAGYKDILTGSHYAPGQGDGAAQIAGSSAPELKSLLGIAVGTLVIAALYFGKEVLIPITLAVMLSFVLSPVVNFLQRLRLPQKAAGAKIIVGLAGQRDTTMRFFAMRVMLTMSPCLPLRTW